MTVESIVTITGLVTTGLITLLFGAKRVMGALAAVVLSTLPVINAVAKVRAAWRDAFGPDADTAPPVAPALEGGSEHDDVGGNVV
ncbi:hypothetical protein ACFRFL_40135 [Streptomyces sp. NPDC056708]|uniref:hypothetical protein n=1 Tax=unclassified Streptomyces TaxID=2593676 RepID=UPI003676FFEE